MSEFEGGWIANLSNGETVFETAPIQNEFTSWRKLLDRCKAENLQITGLMLVRGLTRILAMRPKSCRGYFQAYEKHKTQKFEFEMQGIGSVIGDQVFITWYLLTNPIDKIISQEIRPLDSCQVHTTIP